MSNVMFLFQKIVTTEILDMCVTYKRNATFNETLNELRSHQKWNLREKVS